MRSTAESVHLIAATVGFFSFFLLWLAVVWGMILRNGWAQTRIRHSTVNSVHTVMALLGLCLGLVHALAQLADPTGTVFLVHVLIPFTHPFDAVGIGVGVVSLEFFTALALSILVQRKLGYTRWRAIHAYAYVAFMLLVAHILISGTDTGSPYVSGSVFGAWLVTVVLWLTSTGLFATARRRVGRAVAVRQKGQELSVDVDAVKCARFGFCAHEAPDTFRLRSDGRLSYSGSVPVDRAEAVLRAVEVCPARAISLTQLPTKVFTPVRVEPAQNDPLLGDSGRHRVVAGMPERRASRRRGGGGA